MPGKSTPLNLGLRCLAVALGSSIALLSGPASATVAPEKTGMIDITKAPYNADPTDTKDDAPAIKKALSDIVNTSKSKADYYGRTIYFPAGTYYIGSKITALDKRASGDGTCGSHTGRGTVVMVGETNGAARPLFKLMPNVIPASKAGPMLEIKHYKNKPSCAFRDGFRGIDMDLTAIGNAGATGLRFDAAQDSFLEDVKIDATGADKGISAVPGRSMATANIEVVGGNYGIELDGTSLGATLVGIKLSGQKVAAFKTNIYRGISVTGLEIETGAPQAILIGGSYKSGYPGHLSLYDASIKFSGSGARTAIANPDNRALALTNVYTSNANLIVDRGAGIDDLAQRTPGSTEHILSYVVAPRGIKEDDKKDVVGVYRLTNAMGVATTTTASNATDALNLKWGGASDLDPGDLRSRHLWKKTDSFSDNKAIVPPWPSGFDIKTSDAREPIQKAIDDPANAGKTFFLPAGTYLLNGPLRLKANTRLIGVPGLRSILKPNAWTETSTASFVIKTEDAPDGDTLIQDMAFDTPNDGMIGGMNWRAGRYSMVRHVRTLLGPGHKETDMRDYLIDGPGGGRWYSLADHTNIPASADINCNYRKVLVSGNSQPLTFYGLNIERGGDKEKRTQYPLGELRDAKDVRVFGQKLEVDGAETEAPSSANACKLNRPDQPLDKGLAWDINGATDNVFFAMVFSNDVTTEGSMFRVANGVTRIAIDGLYAKDKDLQARMLLMDENANSPGVINRLQWLGLFSRGEVDHSVFNHIQPLAKHRN